MHYIFVVIIKNFNEIVILRHFFNSKQQLFMSINCLEFIMPFHYKNAQNFMRLFKNFNEHAILIYKSRNKNNIKTFRLLINIVNLKSIKFYKFLLDFALLCLWKKCSCVIFTSSHVKFFSITSLSHKTTNMLKTLSKTPHKFVRSTIGQNIYGRPLWWHALNKKWCS